MDQPATRGIIGLDQRGRIDRLVEKPRPEAIFPDYLVNSGTYVLEPSILARIPAGKACDFAMDIFPRMLADGVPIYGHRMRGQLLSTDTPERYEFARQQVASGAFPLP
jgi:NDP-sugar pyrophosphorylase family protein